MSELPLVSAQSQLPEYCTRSYSEYGYSPYVQPPACGVPACHPPSRAPPCPLRSFRRSSATGRCYYSMNAEYYRYHE